MCNYYQKTQLNCVFIRFLVSYKYILERRFVSKKESYLKEILRKKMAEANLSAHALEKNAGLKRSAVQNILYGKSKKPSAEILGAITKVLGCSISDLLGETNNKPAHNKIPLSPADDDNNVLDANLYAEAVKVANIIFETHNIIPNKQSALNFINEIYQYSLTNNKNEIDFNFAAWLAKRSLDNL